VLADANRGRLALSVFVAQPKRWHRNGFLLEAGKSDFSASALSAARIRPGPKPVAEVHCRFFEYLLVHPCPPDQAGHHDLSDTFGVDGEKPPGVLGFLSLVECVDQIEPGPRHIHAGVGLAGGE